MLQKDADQQICVVWLRERFQRLVQVVSAVRTCEGAATGEGSSGGYSGASAQVVARARGPGQAVGHF